MQQTSPLWAGAQPPGRTRLVPALATHPGRGVQRMTTHSRLTTADRRAEERQFPDYYRATLTAAGGPQLEREDLWTRYRQPAPYPYVASLLTAGWEGCRSKTSPSRDSSDLSPRSTIWTPSHCFGTRYDAI